MSVGQFPHSSCWYQLTSFEPDCPGLSSESYFIPKDTEFDFFFEINAPAVMYNGRVSFTAQFSYSTTAIIVIDPLERF